MGSFSVFHWVIVLFMVLAVVGVVRNIGGRKATVKDGGFDAMIRGPGKFAFEAVGESNYQAAFIDLFGEPTEDGVDEQRTARLVLDDDNPHDSNAVKVTIDGLTLGHLSRKVAKDFRKEIGRQGLDQQFRTFLVPARIRGGWDRGGGDTGMYGIWLDLPQP